MFYTRNVSVSSIIVKLAVKKGADFGLPKYGLKCAQVSLKMSSGVIRTARRLQSYCLVIMSTSSPPPHL